MARSGPIPDAPDDRILVALGFVMAYSEVDTAIVGTHNPAHMMSNIEMVNTQLPIPTGVIAALNRRFEETEEDWNQLG